MSNRFVARTDLVAVQDTKTDTYASFLFNEQITELTDRLNRGEIDTDDTVFSVGGWQTFDELLPLPIEEYLDILREQSVMIAAIVGISVPQYAQDWFNARNPE